MKKQNQNKQQKEEQLSRAKRARQKARAYRKKFNQEIKKALNTAIVAAFGFLIALVWKDVITEYVGAITKISPIQGKLIEAIIVTIIGVLGIVIVTKLFSEKE